MGVARIRFVPFAALGMAMILIGCMAESAGIVVGHGAENFGWTTTFTVDGDMYCLGTISPIGGGRSCSSNESLDPGRAFGSVDNDRGVFVAVVNGYVSDQVATVRIETEAASFEVVAVDVPPLVGMRAFAAGVAPNLGTVTLTALDAGGNVLETYVQTVD